MVIIEGCESGSTNERKVCITWDMEASFFISVLLRQAKVNDADNIAVLTNADQEVAWFDIAVNKVVRVNIFQA